MRHGYLLLVVAGCGFRATAVVLDGVPDGGVPGTWTFSSAAEFAAPGSLAKDMTIDLRGSLTPNAYTYGGLVAHGKQGTSLWTLGDTTWTNLDTVTASGAGLWRGEQLTNTAVLDYVGITTPNKSRMTVWFEGEVWLEAGSAEKFTLDANDVAFIDLAHPGTASYRRVADSGFTMPVETPETGWYPIRVGLADHDSSSSFNFTHCDSGTTMIPWTRDRLRARASELTGVLRTVFGRQILAGGQSGPPVAHFDEGDLLPLTNFDPQPPQGAADNDWSARYLGQVYVTQAGSYTLRITSDDGNRGRLGAARREDHWSRDNGVGGQEAITTLSASLVEGWNDIAVDYNQVSGGQELHVQLQGPEFPSFVEVPRSRLRPVEPADDRLALGGDDTSHGVQDNGGAVNPGTAAMTIAGFSGEMVSAIDVTYEVDSSHWDELKVDLEAPGTPLVRVTIRDQVGLPPPNDHIVQLTIPSSATGALATLLQAPASGLWKLHVYDVRPGGGPSQLKNAKITLHTTGGPDKIARSASWTSPVFDASTNVFAIDGVTWNERRPDGSSIAVEIRSCQQADCDGAVWSPIAPATPLAVDPGRYLQLRVAMTSNGLQEPELSSLRAVYRRSE